MSFQAFNGNGGQTRRNEDKINVYLGNKQPVPDMVPFELRDHISPDEWHMRLTAIRNLGFRFFHPVAERIWISVATIVTIVLPFALYSIIFNSLTKGVNFRDNSSEVSDKVLKAKAISSAAFVGSIVVFWLPMLVWKMIGKKRLRNLCASWYKSDTASRPSGSFVPLWTATLPSVFKSASVVSITMPPNARMTTYHPNAALPPYVNPPVDGGAAYYYPYAAGQNGLPRMSVAGTLPAYQAEPGKEKYFEDVKV